MCGSGNEVAYSELAVLKRLIDLSVLFSLPVRYSHAVQPSKACLVHVS